MKEFERHSFENDEKAPRREPELRQPIILGDVEFCREDSGFGSDMQTNGMTKFEIRITVRHWLAMMWAVETNWDCGTSGSWEVSMYQYANWRLRTLQNSGLVTRDEIDAVANEWDWPLFGEDTEEATPELLDLGLQILDDDDRAEYVLMQAAKPPSRYGAEVVHNPDEGSWMNSLAIFTRGWSEQDSEA